jgi:hypothetical protein
MKLKTPLNVTLPALAATVKYNFISSLVYINNTHYLVKEKPQKRIIQPLVDYKIKY